MKVIGILMVDRRLLPKSDIAQDMWRVNYFASGLIILQLASADSIFKILAVEHDEQDSTIDLCTLLLLSRVHMYTVNSRCVIKLKKQVMMIWTSLIYVLHFDSIHQTTKHLNYGMYFVMFLNDTNWFDSPLPDSNGAT